MGLRLAKLGMAFREQPVADYGIDAPGEEIADGQATGSLLAIQVKAGSSYFREPSPDGWWFRFDVKHASYWLDHALPVVVVLCDIEQEMLYWQRIARDTIQSTGANSKVLVRRDQQLVEASKARLLDAATRPVSANAYSVLKEDDSSHGGAKRLALHVLLNGSPTKSQIGAVAREVTLKYIGSDYTRNPLVEAVWGGVNAHVVCVFLYQTLDDYKNSNIIARSQWIDESLDPAMRPGEFGGQNVGMSVMLDWSSHHSMLQNLLAASEPSKQEYLREADRAVGALADILRDIGRAVGAGGASDFAMLTEKLASARGSIRQITESENGLPTPPLECADLDAVAQTLVAHADNIALYLAPDCTWSDSQAFHLAKSDLKGFEAARKRWEFERAKV